MPDPRDFLPAKYGRSQTNTVQPLFSINKPNDNSEKDIIKKKSKTKLAGLLVIVFLIIGIFSSYLLSQQNQDSRQQATGGREGDLGNKGCDPEEPYCGNDGECEDGYYLTDEKTCEASVGKGEYIYLPTPTPVTCYSGSKAYSDNKCYPNLCWQGSTFICESNSSTAADCPSGEINLGDGCKPKVYTTYPTPINGVCPNDERYNYQLSTGQCIPEGSLAVPIPDDEHNCGTGWQYDSGSDKCKLVCPSGQIACWNNSCATPGVGAPDPCPPQDTTLKKCNGTVTEPGPDKYCDDNGSWCREYRIETMWCSNCTTQTNCHWQYNSSSYNCGPEEQCDGNNPTQPPSTTTAIPSTVTTTAPTPICSNIEMLDASGSVMTEDDDESLKNGDQLKFRATAANASSLTITMNSD